LPKQCKFYLTLLDATRPYPTLLDANRRYSTLLDTTTQLDATLLDATLLDATLLDATLLDATLLDATLRYATLRYATLRYATLLDTTLLDATLRFYVDFEHFAVVFYPTVHSTCSLIFCLWACTQTIIVHLLGSIKKKDKQFFAAL
jgi:uncharacterized protein YjbI with pentapeptide repeats